MLLKYVTIYVTKMQDYDIINGDLLIVAKYILRVNQISWTIKSLILLLII